MKLVVHRGTREIGGSCVEISTSNTRILLDFGMPLVENSGERFDSNQLRGKSISELKQKGILPDIAGLYKNEKRGIDAIFISHSHLDHCGFLQYVHPDIPLYASEGAKELIEITSQFTPTKLNIANTFSILKTNIRNKIREIAITNYTVDHSAFDARAFLIEGDVKRIFYTGDFRGQGRKSYLFKNMVKKPPKDIDCLLLEGSMLGRNENLFDNETEVENAIVNSLKDQQNISFIFVSSQNIDRIVSAYKACLRSGKLFVIDLYTAYILFKLRRISKNIPQYDWNNIRVYFFKNQADIVAKIAGKELLYKFNKKKIRIPEVIKSRKNVLMIMRDNSIFPKIAGKLVNVNGTKIIYSMWDGYLTEKFHDYCTNSNIEILKIHTSGHAAVHDLQLLAEAIDPKVIVPIHTFEPHQYKQLFKNVVLLKDHEEYSLN